MKPVNKLLRVLAVLIVLCMTMSTVAYAAESGKVWLSVTESANGKDTIALIVTDTTVTDGLVKVTYDPESLTYKGVMVSSGYVAMHSVNAEEPGVVLISWVAPEAYESDGSTITLIEVTFEGTEEETTVEAVGVAHDEAGTEYPIGTVDTSALEETIAKAEDLSKEDWTEESWADLEEALKAAQETLEDPTATQSEIDAAAAALEEAIAALEEAVEPEGTEAPEQTVDKSELEKAMKTAQSKKQKGYTKKSYDALQAALKVAKSVYADEDATQEEVDAATDALNKAIKALVPTTGKNPVTGDDSQPVLVAAIAAIALIGIGALVVMNNKNKKKGGK